MYPYVALSSGVRIGSHVTILANVVVNHDTIIGDYSIVASAAHLSGGVRVGRCCYIGAGSHLISTRNHRRRLAGWDGEYSNSGCPPFVRWSSVTRHASYAAAQLIIETPLSEAAPQISVVVMAYNEAPLTEDGLR